MPNETTPAASSNQAATKIELKLPNNAKQFVSADDPLFIAARNMGAIAALYEVVQLIRAEAQRSRKHDVIHHCNNIVNGVEQLARKYAPDLPPPPRTEPDAGARPRTAND